jgi:hypothetical protein
MGRGYWMEVRLGKEIRWRSDKGRGYWMEIRLGKEIRWRSDKGGGYWMGGQTWEGD